MVINYGEAVVWTIEFNLFALEVIEIIFGANDWSS